MIDLHQRLVLNSDVVIRHAGLAGPPEMPEEFIVTRTASRSPSLAVNRETAEFLLVFSSPCSLLNAVQLASRRVPAEPETVLDELYANIQIFLERSILVRAGQVRREKGLRRIGAWSLERPINDFDDSSVYLVKNASGQFGALKLMSAETAGGLLDRERRALELAGPDLAPAVLDFGASPLGPYLVTEWKAGSVAAEAFRELRRSRDPRPALLRMAICLVDAFERLHERGVLHGDIQPKNAIVDLRDRIWIIDFSHSRVPGLPFPGWRVGVPFFFEPEYAGCLLAEPAKSSPLSEAGENYAVAAMLFYLLSGIHSIEYSMEREVLLHQIAAVEPRNLADPLGRPWDAADAAIRPYLAKNPQLRPPSLAGLRTGLERALSQEVAAPPSSHPDVPRIRRQTPPERAIREQFGLGSARLRTFDVMSPRCSLTYGAAGIAYALLRASELCGDGEMLWAADAWIEQAERHAAQPEAFTAPRIDLTRRRIGYASLSSAEPGMFFVKALVRSAAGDARGAGTAVDQFLSAAARRPSHHADVNLGGVGLALAADRLSGLTMSSGHRRQLREFRDQLVARSWLAVQPAFRDAHRLGFAHGIAGMVFAALTAGQSPEAGEAAARLRSIPVMLRKGLRWPVRAGGDFFMPGWCNGVAGHLLLWTRIWQWSGLAEDREMMERVAWGVWESRTAMGNVCCGAAGQALALAAFAFAVRDDGWRKRAESFLAALRPRWPKDDHPQSLFRGELGLLLARLECDAGAPPRFPVWGASLEVRPQ